jgi:stalled ribosome rescue protein Dom34
MPEESEDMWHAYNLISEGDCVRASTIRSGNLRLRHIQKVTSWCRMYFVTLGGSYDKGA